MPSSMDSVEETINHLREARDYLAIPGNWSSGIGDEHTGQTCALGSLAMSYGWRKSFSTDAAVEHLVEHDGPALIALAKALPEPTKLAGWHTYDWHVMRHRPNHDDAYFMGDLATSVYRFNDWQPAEVGLQYMLGLFDRAIEILTEEGTVDVDA